MVPYRWTGTTTPDVPCDYCLTNLAAGVEHLTPDGRKVFFCWDCRDRNPLSDLIADVCQRGAPLLDHYRRGAA